MERAPCKFGKRKLECGPKKLVNVNLLIILQVLIVIEKKEQLFRGIHGVPKY